MRLPLLVPISAVVSAGVVAFNVGTGARNNAAKDDTGKFPSEKRGTAIQLASEGVSVGDGIQVAAGVSLVRAMFDATKAMRVWSLKNFPMRFSQGQGE